MHLWLNLSDMYNFKHRIEVQRKLKYKLKVENKR